MFSSSSKALLQGSFKEIKARRELRAVKAKDCQNAGFNQQAIYNNLLGDLVQPGSPATVSTRARARRASKVAAGTPAGTPCRPRHHCSRVGAVHAGWLAGWI